MSVKAVVLASEWLSAQEALDRLGIASRTLQEWAQKNKLRWKEQGREGKRAERLYHAGDVARLEQAREDMGKVQGNPVRSLAVAKAGAPGAIAQLAELQELLKELLVRKPEPAPEPKAWLTLDEAAAVSGLTPVYIRDRAAVGAIASCRGGKHGRILVNRASLLEFRG